MPSKYVPKLLSQEAIDKLKGSAKENAQRNRGLAVDEELKILLPRLREQIKDFPDLQYNQSCIIPPWIDEGVSVIRNEAYGKVPLDFAEEGFEEEEGKAFEDREYSDCYVDSLAAEFARRAKAFHLPPGFVDFVIRVLEAALHHGRDLPGAAFQQKQELVEYLAELKAGSGTYREPPKPKGKPGPKPKTPQIPDHAEGKSYVTYSPEAKPDHSGVRDDMPLDFRNWK